MNKEELGVILDKHDKWLKNEPGGRCADLQGAYLRRADLQGAYLRGANLQGAYLLGANLQDANLQDANLWGAYLLGANLQDANLQDANLQGADLWGAKNIPAVVVAATTTAPPEGDIIGWKKALKPGGIGTCLVKLRIPASAKRSNATGRKCRSEFAEVLAVEGAECAISRRNPSVVYRVGEIVRADAWDEDRWNECSHGIHFFITREEAEEYNL